MDHSPWKDSFHGLFRSCKLDIPNVSMRQFPRLFATTMAALGAVVLVTSAARPAAAPRSAGPAPLAGAQAAGAAVAPYTETIPGTAVSFDMVPVPGGTFTMGSPAAEHLRGEDE